MSNAPSGSPVAGWYPDPAGSGRTRWWDGSRWTENFSEAAPGSAAASAPVVAAPVAPVDSSPGAAWSGGTAATPYPNAAPYSGATESLRAPAGTNPYTPWIWALALLPIVNTVVSLIQLPNLEATIEAATQAATQTPTAPMIDPFSSLLSLLLFGLSMLFIVLDWRALTRAAVPRPFHWAWGFFMIVGAPVYMIGRSIVVRRRTGGGLAPMFINLALLLVNVAIGIAILVITFTAVIENTPLPQ
jgi:hypothetical protein